jgi:hypothetical protein
MEVIESKICCTLSKDCYRSFALVVDCRVGGESLGPNNGSKAAVFRNPRALTSDRTSPAESRVIRSENDDYAAYCLRTGT